jgi:lipopolysaccharide/colanic/teichoic acid biosynthesis glycosyltransferase
MAVKRGIDVSLSAGLGLIALPLMVLIALAIRLDSPGPALFRASRIGRHGRHFSMLKFRTMVADAEKRFHEFAHLNVADGMVKIPDDPRVTRIGKWLRRFSLDELPQVYNVLVGHMSIVGPRPHDVHDLPADQIRVDRRLKMRPGLTGLWQVTARSNPSLETRLHWDRVYVDRWSLKTDLAILAKTVPVVIRGQGGRIVTPEVPNWTPSKESDPGGPLQVEGSYLSTDPIQTMTPTSEYHDV